jgi:hypothetical protein
MHAASFRDVLTATAVLALTGTGVAYVSAQAPAAKAYAAPRTPWGHPDLQGTYSNDDETGTPMERPADLAGKTLKDITPEELQKIVKARNERFVEGVSGDEFAGGLRPPTHLIFDSFDRKSQRAWLVVDPPDGRIPPMTDEAKRRPRAPGGVSTNFNPVGPFNSWLDMGLYDRCITRGIPASMMPAGYGSFYQIVQSPDSVAIRYEMIHETRVVPFDRHPTVSPAIRQYLGDARAWWEGETLVVETRNFPQETAPQRGSDKVTMTERFTAVSPGTVEWSVTFADPTTWTRPWTFMMPLTKVAPSQEIYEYACHEGNNAMRNILSAQRASEREKAAGK